jgi:PII-like signaling protein
MQGWSLRFYVHENRMHGATPMHEWLLEQARAHNAQGGSAFRAIAGFGRHGVINEQHFFELAGQSTILVEFIVTQEQADALLGLVHAEKLPIFYVRFPVEYGVDGATG